MSLKNICLIPKAWTLADYSQHTCSDGSHSHLSHAAVSEKDSRGLVVWLKKAATRHESSVVWLLPDPREKWNPRARDAGDLLHGSAVNTGLSFRVGEYLAGAVYYNEAWAHAMLQQMRVP